MSLHTRSVAAAAAFALGALLPGPAFAHHSLIVSWRFEGAVSDVADNIGHVSQEIAVDDPCSGSLTYDLGVADSWTFSDKLGIYDSAPPLPGLGVTLLVDAAYFRTDPPQALQIKILDDSGFDDLSATSAGAVSTFGYPADQTGLTLTLQDPTMTAFASDALPLALDAGDFATHHATFSYDPAGTAFTSVTCEIDLLVPQTPLEHVPALGSAARGVLAVGLVAVAAAARRVRRRARGR